MPENQDTRLRDMARRVLDQNRYMVLGTSEADHRPRVSPVFFTHDRYRTLYWVSSPDAQHSRNLAEPPRSPSWSSTQQPSDPQQ